MQIDTTKVIKQPFTGSGFAFTIPGVGAQLPVQAPRIPASPNPIKKRPGKYYAEVLAKLLVVETSARVLSQLKEAEAYQPALLWMREEVERVMIELAHLTDKPMKHAKRADRIIKAVRAMKDDLPADAEPEPDGDIYLASAITIILDDLLAAMSQKESDLVKPLLECALTVEGGLDKDFEKYDTRKEAASFIERVYQRIQEVN